MQHLKVSGAVRHIYIYIYIYIYCVCVIRRLKVRYEKQDTDCNIWVSYSSVYEQSSVLGHVHRVD